MHAQSCPTLCFPMDCSLPGSSIHEIFQARILELGCHFLLQGIFPTQGSNPCLLQRETDFLPLHHLGKPRRPMKTNDSAQKPSGKEKEFFLIQPFILFSAPLADWMRSTHTESESEVAQSYLTLCDPMDCSLPGSTVHGIFQAKILQWVAISFSRRSSRPRD